MEVEAEVEAKADSRTRNSALRLPTDRTSPPHLTGLSPYLMLVFMRLWSTRRGDGDIRYLYALIFILDHFVLISVVVKINTHTG